MGRLTYKGYYGSVEYDETSNELTGKVLGLRNTLVLYEGNTIEELKKDFQDAVDDYLEGCRAKGIEPEKPYSGKLILRITPSLHGIVAEKAHSQGISMNEFINRAIQAAVS